MSKIIFYLKSVSNLNVSARLIKQCTGESLSSLLEAIKSSAPIAQFILYENNHGSVSEIIKKLINNMSEQDAELEIYEVEPNEGIEFCSEQTKISTEILINLLDGFREESEIQRERKS